MIGLIIELFVLTLLVLILILLLLDEKRLKIERATKGRITGYWDGKERRASIRINTILNINYYIDKKNHPKKNSFSKNISNGGILMQLNEKLAPSTLLALEINLPNEEKPIIAEGEVAWMRELSQMDENGKRVFDTGIKFIAMDQRDKERLDRHIKGFL